MLFPPTHIHHHHNHATKNKTASDDDDDDPPAGLVLWPRIDQKSCLKAILTAGLIPVPLPLRQDGDALATDLEGLRAKLEEYGGPRRVLCVLSTTSCFAPRVPDAVRGRKKEKGWRRRIRLQIRLTER